MFSKVFGIGLSGIDAYEVSVEVDVSDGLPAFVMVGVLAAEVKEAQDRVRTALRNGGFTLRPQKVTVNLSPAGVRKSGTAFDLAIAAGVIRCVWGDRLYGISGCSTAGRIRIRWTSTSGERCFVHGDGGKEVR